MDPNSKTQPIQQGQQAQSAQQDQLIQQQNQIPQPQAPVSVPVGSAEGAPASVTPNEIPVSVSPENILENGAEFASAPNVPSSVGQVGVIGHPSADVHPDLKKEIKEAESLYKPTWQTAQQAEEVRKESKADQGLYGLATEFLKSIQRKISGSSEAPKL
jgi:hypothetical protein